MPGTRKVAALDGLRVLAIAAIVVYHANPTWLPGGYFGVTVFFALTGYLTTISIEHEVARTGRFDYPRFLLRRVGRLLPAAVVVVGATALLCALFSPALLPKVKTDAVPALLFFENLFYIVRNVSYFAAAGLPSPLTHLWYLGVVMQFYVVWPPLLLGLSKLVRRRGQACVVVAALMVASAVAMAALYNPLGDTNRIYYGPDTRAAELLAGALCALLTQGHGWRLTLPVRGGAGPAAHAAGARSVWKAVPGWAYELAGLGSLVGLGAMAVTLNGYSEFAYRGGILLAALLTAVLIGVLARPAGGVLSRVLGLAPLAALGRRGFAVYLWHYPLLLVMNPATRTTELPWWGWVLEFAVIAAVSELSYRVLERGVGRPLALGQGRLALGLEAAALVCVLVVSLAPISAEQTGVPVGQQATQSQTADLPNPETDGYDVSGTYLAGTAFASAVDTINALNYGVDVETGATDANVTLVGDSVALGAQTQFQRVFPNGWIDAEVGRQLTAGLDVYNQCVADGHGGDVVVFALGNNGVAREDQVRALIDACGDRKVYLVTCRVPMALQDMNNQLFRDVAATYDNVEVIDWYAESAGHDDWFWSDGTHLRPEGAEAYVMMLRRAITGR
ncbi:acyltransferase family protein [Olsenella profusa]|uniref:Acetyltransferase n=1 Tax=Olsenella profusa TaxID=138595 RepID=A0ABS2EZJ9_9ACTN|nr:acyltransferase family protein [Olsenella profusa]MBM6774134.1 acetyltransferase [Olsenella profusa]